MPKIPARWRWTSKAKTRRELWRGPDLLASIELEDETAPLWTWRVVGSDRWGTHASRWMCQAVAKDVARV